MPPEIGSLLAESQRRLQAAESHHEKMVKQAQGRLHTLLLSEASMLAGALQSYSAALSGATNVFIGAANATRAEVDLEERRAANATNAGDGWGGPEVEARARLSAKVQMAEREGRRMQRQQVRLLEEAQRKAGDVLEAAVPRLSRKVGDVTPLLEEAKGAFRTLPSRAANVSATVLPAGLTQMAEALAVGKVQAAAEVSKAEKDFDAKADNATRALEAGVASIAQDLVISEKKELASIHDPGAAPTASKEHHTKKGNHTEKGHHAK